MGKPSDPLRFERVTPRFGIEGLKAAREAFHSAWLIRMPVLVQQARAERIVDADKVRQFFDNLASQDKAWKIYDGLYHEPHEEPEKDIVLEDMWTWLERRLPS